jgi:folate-binding protein YgfZ
MSKPWKSVRSGKLKTTPWRVRPPSVRPPIHPEAGGTAGPTGENAAAIIAESLPPPAPGRRRRPAPDHEPPPGNLQAAPFRSFFLTPAAMSDTPHTTELPADLPETWRQTLLAAGARCAADDAGRLAFAEPLDEVRAARQSSVLTPLTQLATLAVEGGDARDFLHKQLTQDVQTLAPGELRLAAWCSPKGRMLANFLVHALPAGQTPAACFHLLTAAELLPDVSKRLQMFVLRAQVRISGLRMQRVHVGLAGPATLAALAAAGLPYPEKRLGSAVDAAGQSVCRLADDRCIVSAPPENLARLWPILAAHARPVGRAAWDWLDIQAPMPWITAATREEFVPQMLDFEQLGGLNFKKGCYPGQEVVARAQYLGKVKRHLYRIHGPQPLAAGENLYAPASPEQAVGKVVLAAPEPEGGHVALAVLLATAAADLRQGGPNGVPLKAVAVHPDAHA